MMKIVTIVTIDGNDENDGKDGNDGNDENDDDFPLRSLFVQFSWDLKRAVWLKLD